MSWKIVGNNGGKYPPRVQVDNDTIELNSEQIDAALPESCRVVGTIIFTPDCKKIKTRTFNDEWVENQNINIGTLYNILYNILFG